MNAYLYESRKDMHNYGKYYISMIYSKIISSKTLTIAVLFDVGNFLSAHFRPVLPFRTPQTGSGKSEVFWRFQQVRKVKIGLKSVNEGWEAVPPFNHCIKYRNFT